MAEPPKTPTKAATRVCRTCNENIVVKNHPLDLFGARASQENIPSMLERFFVFNDGLPSYICRCCHHKVIKFQEFLRKIAFSREQQESVLRVKRGKTTAESPSGRSPQTRRDLKKRRILYEDAPANGPSCRSLFQIHVDKPSKTRPRPILPAPSKEGDWKKRKLAKRNESSAEPSTPSKQEEILSQSGLLNPLVF